MLWSAAADVLSSECNVAFEGPLQTKVRAVDCETTWFELRPQQQQQILHSMNA